ncbi:MAG: Smr/MutS family protein [Desulfovibrionaceae bacterium]
MSESFRAVSIQKRTLKALEFYKVLDKLAFHCLSVPGRQAALDVRPHASIEEACLHMCLFDEGRTWLTVARQASAQDTGFRLSSFPDITQIMQSVFSSSAVLDAEALWGIREILHISEKALQSLARPEALTHWPTLFERFGHASLPKQTLSGLNRCLTEDGHLKDESSPELHRVRAELRRLHQSCMHKVKDFANQYAISHYLQDEFMTLSSDRYVLPMKANFKSRLQGIIHDWSQTGETCYFEPMFLVEINNRLQELKHEEREEERKIFAYLTSLVRDEAPAISVANDFLLFLDVLQAKVKFADALHGECVNLTTGGGVQLFAARHPLLVLSGSPAHPIDIHLREHERGLIISGGNAGGKTVCLKTLGLMAAMTLAALPVSVGKGSSLPPWQRIFAFIGDEQSLDDHVSTFTAQIQNLAHAWEQTDKNTLILLDEFGAGTDPAQGAALAQAVLDALLDIDAYVVAATHFPALKAYALTREKARAASVLFDPNTKRPLFCLAYDQVGASQALDVAREHGLPEGILRRAEQYLLLSGEDASALMARLNALAVEREKENTLLREEQERQRNKRLQLQERFERERKQLYDEMRKQSATLLQAWKEGRTSHKQTLKEMARLRTKLLPESTESPPPELQADQVRIGQEVLHKGFGKKARVTDIDTRKKRVRIDMNGLVLWANLLDIQDISPSSPLPSQQVLVHVQTQSSPLTLDLRGKRADLAMSEVAQFLDSALLAGRSVVEVVHGRGTGVLRKQIHAFLQTFPGIKDFSLAPEDRGGDGMTIVTFK